MKLTSILFLVVTGYCVTGCRSHIGPDSGHVPDITPIRNNKNIMDARNIPFIHKPDYRNFSICYGHTCNTIETLRLSEQEWGKIRSIFEPAAISAVNEREQITVAIAEMETMVGIKTGTQNDLPENFSGLGLYGQLDCVDESTNTSVYLTIMQADNLLRWHRVEKRASRGIGSFQVPHFTAVIRDTQDDVTYAVDSWYLANGEPPFIVPMTQWRKGWRPE